MSLKPPTREKLTMTGYVLVCAALWVAYFVFLWRYQHG